MSFRRPSAVLAAVLLAAGSGSPLAQAPSSGAPYTVLSRDARRALAARTIGGQEMFALDDLARLFEFTFREDALAGGLALTVRNQTIVLSPGQGLASVGGRLISLPAPPVREGRSWFVPVDFVPRALAPALGSRVELRKPSRLILLGDVRVPRIAGRVEPLGSLARLTLDVAPATRHSVTHEGSRLIVRFEADALDGTLPASTAAELIQAVRPGDAASAIAIELGARFATFRASDAPADRGAGRIVIDVMAQTTEAPQPGQPPPPTQPPPTEPPPLLEIAPSAGLRTIVLDAGHGGREAGAKGPGGGTEKDVTLAVARRLKATIESRLGVRVILTRDGDETVGLDERAAVANNNKADLFLSLHANASVRPTVTGAEVFYLSLDAYGDEARRLARGEVESLPVFGGGTRTIEVIPWEMAQARHVQQSAVFAAQVEAALRARVPMSARALQQAPFRVLVGANMPAALVEMGFMTNAEQERQLTSDGFQSTLVQALFDAIVAFRDGRGTPPSTRGRP